jgi:hypothetical protein
MLPNYRELEFFEFAIGRPHAWCGNFATSQRLCACRRFNHKASRRFKLEKIETTV